MSLARRKPGEVKLGDGGLTLYVFQPLDQKDIYVNCKVKNSVLCLSSNLVISNVCPETH